MIADDSRIRVSFSLTDGQTGDNSPLDPPTVSTHADIRYRGNSSRFFDKKSYSIHLVDENGAEDPQALAGHGRARRMGAERPLSRPHAAAQTTCA